jgi:3-mercaptopyruvate sulfurtransferase SseA
MRPYSLIISFVILGAIALAGCSAAGNKVTKIQQPNNNTTPTTPSTTQADGARRITIAELQDLMKKHEVFIVDVRNEVSFNTGHLPGAKLIPAGEILNHVDELPKDKLIVTYCS